MPVPAQGVDSGTEGPATGTHTIYNVPDKVWTENKAGEEDQGLCRPFPRGIRNRKGLSKCKKGHQWEPGQG